MNVEDYSKLHLASIQVEAFKDKVEKLWDTVVYEFHPQAYVDRIVLEKNTISIFYHTEFRGEYDESYAAHIPYEVIDTEDTLRAWNRNRHAEEKRIQEEKEEAERKREQEEAEAHQRLLEKEAAARNEAAIRAFLVEKFGEEKADELLKIKH